MGVVWRAIDERLERSVAIKQILAQPGLSEAERVTMRQRAMREAKNAARFQHPNAIVVFDIAEHAGDPCLVMEYLPSESLSAILAENETLPLGQVTKIGHQVASALVAAHRAGVVHRDIKPGNILIDESGITKITDFGISRAAGDLTLTQTGLIGGTPAYLAPELARGSDPSPASDVFSLGATLYQALEGETPYGNSTNQLAVLYAAANGQVIPPRKSGKATALIMSLLRADPQERPGMTEVRDRLTALGAEIPAPAMTLVAPSVGGSRSPVNPVSSVNPAGWQTPTASPRQGVTPPWQRASAPAGAQSPNPPARTAFSAPPVANSAPQSTPAKLAGTKLASNKKVLFGSVITLVVIIAAAILFAVNSGEDSPNGNAQAPAQQNASPSALPTGLGQSPSSKTVEYRPAGLRVVAFYSFPDGMADSWGMLTPAAQQVYGTQQNFQQYWSKFKSVYSAGATGTHNADSSANITLTVTADSGSQKKTLRVVDSQGTLLIDGDTKLAGT
jgi:serine/threonine protein kinase